MTFKIHFEFSGLTVVHLDKAEESKAASAAAYLAPYAAHRPRMYIPIASIGNQGVLATDHPLLGWNTIAAPGGQYFAEAKMDGVRFGTPPPDTGAPAEMSVTYALGDKAKIKEAAVPAGKDYWRPINHSLDLADFFSTPTWSKAVSRVYLPGGALVSSQPLEEPDRLQLYKITTSAEVYKRVLADRMRLEAEVQSANMAFPFEYTTTEGSRSGEIILQPLKHDQGRPVTIAISCDCCLVSSASPEDLTGFDELFHDVVYAATIEFSSAAGTIHRPVCPAVFYRTSA